MDNVKIIGLELENVKRVALVRMAPASKRNCTGKQVRQKQDSPPIRQDRQAQKKNQTEINITQDTEISNERNPNLQFSQQ